MKPKLIKSISEISLKYDDIPENSTFNLENKSVSTFPFDILNEAIWSINFPCYECGIKSDIFKYNPLIAIKTPLQPSFIRLVPCYSKFFNLESLDYIANAFQDIVIRKYKEHSFLGPEELDVQDAFIQKTTLAYTRCENCGQEYLARYQFFYPDNDRKEKPDPALCRIFEIIQTDIYFEKNIESYIKLKNITT